MGAKRRIKRDYRQYAPTRLEAMGQKVKRGLTNNTRFPQAFWQAYDPLRRELFDCIDRYAAIYHIATDGAKSTIRERDRIGEELVGLLDEMASALETGATRDPEALYSTGFNISEERRSAPREKPRLVQPVDFMVLNSAEPNKAVGTASSMVGAVIQEIHINRGDPSIETDWLHKINCHDPNNMVMEGLQPGNTFFRMRYFGLEGAGPWSAIVSVTIT